MTKTTKTTRTGTGGRTPPHNVEAEEALLGAAMMSPDAYEVAVTEVEASDFYVPVHATIHDAMRRLWESGVVAVDSLIVQDELACTGGLEEAGGSARLMSMMAMVPSIRRASEYARLIVEYSTMRRMIAAGLEIAEMGYGHPADVAMACEEARELVGRVEVPMGASAPSPDVSEFLAEDHTIDWLVPGLLEARDRLIITGGEGGGKSTLLRQVAVQLAAGLHPFNFRPIRPMRVLVVDLENTASQIERKIRPMVDFVAARLDPSNLRLEVRTGGIDLTQRHDSRWLLERVASNRPDVLITGPIYKLHADDPNDELPARKVARVFDMIREKYGTALVIEAHSPHGGDGRRNLRPFGSSLWLRWPEFGFGLRADREAGEIDGRPAAVYLEPWRGSRDEREWPVRLSGDGADFWPWRDAALPVRS